MQCKDLQTKIAVRDELTPDERSHVDTCRECDAFAAFDSSLSDQLADWRATVPALTRRAARPSYRLWAYAGVGLATMLTLAIVAIPTESTAELAYRRMFDETRQVHSVHMVVRWRPGDGNPEDGPFRTVEEIWWTPDALREQSNGGRPTLKRVENGTLMFYRYQPAEGKVVRMYESARQTDYHTFNLAVFARDYIGSPARFDQPSATEIVATNREGWSRMTFSLDAKTGLPTHAVKQFLRDHQWLTSGEIDLQFDVPIPVDRFEPDSLIEHPQP